MFSVVLKRMNRIYNKIKQTGGNGGINFYSIIFKNCSTESIRITFSGNGPFDWIAW